MPLEEFGHGVEEALLQAGEFVGAVVVEAEVFVDLAQVLLDGVFAAVAEVAGNFGFAVSGEDAPQDGLTFGWQAMEFFTDGSSIHEEFKIQNYQFKIMGSKLWVQIAGC